MQGVGRADVLLYFKCPTTMQMLCPVNAYDGFVEKGDDSGSVCRNLFFEERPLPKYLAGECCRYTHQKSDRFTTGRSLFFMLDIMVETVISG
ncbi:MAG: hypothetical protein AB1Z20_11815, partial [Desulfobacterales bacterium]